MRMFKYIGALIVVLAFGIGVVSQASAAETPWQFLPGSKGETFTGELKEGALTLQEEGGGAFQCTKLSILLEGSELTGPEAKDSTTAIAHLHYSGCKELGLAMNSAGDASGVILVHVKMHTCLIEIGGKAKQDGALITPESEVPIEFTSGKKLITTYLATSGFVAPLEKVGVSQYLLKAVQREGVQEIRKCEGGTAESLLALPAGSTTENKVAEGALVTIKFDKTLDIEEVLA